MTDIDPAAVRNIEPAYERTTNGIEHINIRQAYKRKHQPALNRAGKAKQEGDIQYYNIQGITWIENAQNTPALNCDDSSPCGILVRVQCLYIVIKHRHQFCSRKGGSIGERPIGDAHRGQHKSVYQLPGDENDQCPDKE